VLIWNLRAEPEQFFVPVFFLGGGDFKEYGYDG
jgi:hypothetical protein